MRVWIEQEMCTGDGLCEEICPQMFILADDGMAYVMVGGKRLDAGGAAQPATVAPEHEDAVAEAERECPGECIHMEVA